MRSLVYVSLIIVLLVSLLPVTTAQAGGIVNPADMQGWFIVDDNGKGGGWGDFTNGPDTPPAGTGSARLVLENNLAGWAFVRPMNAGTPLADITRLEYSTYVTLNDSVQAITLAINVDYDSADAVTGWQGRLVYEPYFNGTVTKNTWQTWNAVLDDARWFATGGAGRTACPQSAPCTWATIKETFPNAGFHTDSGLSAVVFKAGSGWTSFEGNFDNFVIGVNGTDEIFDFEPPSTVYVDDDWSATAYNTDPDAGGPANLMGVDAFATVQEGVDAVAFGGTVQVAEGSYQEQVIVRNQDGITIDGDGEALTTITSPVSLAQLVGDRRPVVLVENSEDVTIQNLTVDGAGHANGNYRMFGLIFHNASGLIDHLTVKDIREEPLSGMQQGVAVYGFNEDAIARTLTITNSTATGYQKGGFVFHGVGLMGVASSNTAEGIGPTPLIAMNGFQVSGGASAQISGNVITGHWYTGADWSASGIILYDTGPVEISDNIIDVNQTGVYAYWTDLTLQHNQVTANEWGVFVEDAASVITGNTIAGNGYGIDVYGDGTEVTTASFNRIVGNTVGIANELEVPDGRAVPPVEAFNNWWGCNEGPDTADCDTTQGPVTADPWLVLTLTANIKHVVPGNPIDLIASIAKNSDGESVGSAGDFPDDQEITFATTVGTLTPSIGDVARDGSLTAALSVEDSQPLTTASVSTTLDNETVSLDILAGLARLWLPVIKQLGN